MERKQLVYIVPEIYTNGGLARVTIQIANLLCKTGKYDIQIISIAGTASTPITYKIDSEISVGYLNIPKFNLRRDFLKVAYQLRMIIPASFSGTIIVDDIGYTISAWLGLRHCKHAKFICWTHTNFFNGSKWGFSGWGKHVAGRYFDQIVTLTKEDFGYYQAVVPEKKLFQIYNPINAEIARLPYREDSQKIISCGRLDKVKGFDYLIEVARIVFAEQPDWRWDIYGDGPEKESLQLKIRNYNLENNVFLMGYSSDILSQYNRYSFNVFTSRGEGCPLAMIEALASGLPVVSFNFSCGPKDLISHGANGFIVDNFNINEMAQYILYLMHNPKIRKKFSDSADMNLAELSIDYVIKQWEFIL